MSRVHLVGLPNAATSRAFPLDGFSQMNWKFAALLKGLGHTVLHYGVEGSDAACDEFISVLTEEERTTLLGTTPYQHAAFHGCLPLWALANPRTAREIAARKAPRDLICQIGGVSQQSISAAHPDLITLEYSVGYISQFSAYRIFESHVWRHWSYAHSGWQHGRYYDDVIPCFYDPAEFPLAPKEDFLLYVGRFTHSKGVATACDVAQRVGLPLYLIGHGDRSLITYGECLGSLPDVDRNAWMARARAVLCPTTYLEPFCQVAAEAQLAGTPVIASDFGGFVETVEQGVTGMRCRYLGEFLKAVEAVAKLDPAAIRARAIARYSLATAAEAYQRYLERLETLYTADGWYTAA